MRMLSRNFFEDFLFLFKNVYQSDILYALIIRSWFTGSCNLWKTRTLQRNEFFLL